VFEEIATKLGNHLLIVAMVEARSRGREERSDDRLRADLFACGHPINGWVLSGVGMDLGLASPRLGVCRHIRGAQLQQIHPAGTKGNIAEKGSRVS
jgi:hypothetical protein